MDNGAYICDIRKGDTTMHSKITDWAIAIQSIAQAGLAYGENVYDKERYTQLRQIAAEMIASEADLPVDTVQKFFCNETGYQTPKVDTRAAVFREGKILLVHEKNDTWSLPGGWCEVNLSVAENTIKETREEAGLEVKAERIIAVQDWRRHNECNLPYGVTKIFVLCKEVGGEFLENSETVGIRFFGKEELPDHLAKEKTTAEQIFLCFAANEAGEHWKTQFD